VSPWELAKSGTEHAHQVALMAWANMAATYGFRAANDAATYADKALAEKYAERRALNEKSTRLERLYAIPNGGQRHGVVAARLKAEGVKAGVPDLHLPVAMHGYHSLYIELKKKGGKVSPSQTEWHIALRLQNNCVVVCYSWEEAASTLQNYLTI